MAGWWPTALERRIALRYLRGQRGTRSASLQTIVAIGGIATGVMALVVVLGVMNGLRDDLRDRILVASPHIRVLTYGDALVVGDWESALATIRAVEGVAAAAPEVISQSMVVNPAGHPMTAKIAGLEPGIGSRDVIGFDSAIVSGAFPDTVPLPDTLDGSILLGARLALSLNAYPGDVIQMISPRSARASRITGTPTPVYWLARVSGTFETGMFIYDNEFVVMTRQEAQDFAGLGNSVSDIAVRVHDAWQAPAVAARIDEALGPPYYTETWQQQNAQLFSALKLEKIGMGLVIFFIMVVAAFNIVGTLSMVVAFKTREIGILQAMGLERRGIGRIFLAQGAIVGLVGASLGLALGLLVAWIVDSSGLIRLEPSIYFIDRLPIQVDPLDVAVVVGAALAIALLATIHPVRQAVALAPVDAVRAE
jgi:lipoprotein-releasing system permease protein